VRPHKARERRWPSARACADRRTPARARSDVLANCHEESTLRAEVHGVRP
jgi:hypothetical protein